MVCRGVASQLYSGTSYPLNVTPLGQASVSGCSGHCTKCVRICPGAFVVLKCSSFLDLICMPVPFQYRLEASFLEIYNETLRDLLAPPSSSSNQDSKLEIRMDPAKSNEVYVTHLTTVEVTSETQVLWAWPSRGLWEEGNGRGSIRDLPSTYMKEGRVGEEGKGWCEQGSPGC